MSHVPNKSPIFCCYLFPHPSFTVDHWPFRHYSVCTLDLARPLTKDHWWFVLCLPSKNPAWSTLIISFFSFSSSVTNITSIHISHAAFQFPFSMTLIVGWVSSVAYLCSNEAERMREILLMMPSYTRIFKSLLTPAPVKQWKFERYFVPSPWYLILIYPLIPLHRF